MTDRRGEVLLTIARDAVVKAVRPWDAAPDVKPDEPWLQELGATFVTLRLGGALRGCIGSLTARVPLLQDLRQNAAAAALRDPRFAPLSEVELADVLVEVSLLGPLEDVPVADEAEALVRLGEGRDGWFLTSGRARGTFLPQVWDDLPEPRDFLRRLKQKAGLAPDVWPADVRLQRYRVEKWAEN